MGDHIRNPFASASGSGGAGGSSSASSNSSFSSSVADTEDDHTIARILAEDESLRREGMLGRRLSHLDSIPHTPRINRLIPDINDATLDHELLSGRLATYGLAELQMEGDGNCQFRALADQLFRNPDYHKHVRKHIVKHVLSEKHSATLLLVHKIRVNAFRDACLVLCIASAFRIESLVVYFVSASKDEWLSHTCGACLEVVIKTLISVALNSSELFGHIQLNRKICLVTSFREQSYIEILPHNKNPLKEAWLSFWNEVHYNSLYTSGVSYASRCSHTTTQEEALALLGMDSYIFESLFGIFWIITKIQLSNSK
ncbi:unnamed protein product [Eruca vesicaria subsp. sativa]|uniref:OTU domain-containing protein n=1 Tax=Eruca vesicaria subsp. sativa TaxID=29727 RepID=A0ABC8LB61_ERUVS|nr:unnamed protein product [Eruca vesicaria subsp. sativa]